MGAFFVVRQKEKREEALWKEMDGARIPGRTTKPNSHGLVRD